MTGFSVDWLNLREAADQQARNGELLRVAAAFAASGGDAQAVVVDLGAGTGSTYRTFGQHGFSAKFTSTWRLVDNDRELLGEAARRADQNRRIETYELDLNDVAQLPLTAVRLITASALFDLVSAPFIDRLISEVDEASARRPVGIYAALNYDGSTCWDPVHPLDQQVLEAFNEDQTMDKGFGPALGPDACAYVKQALEQAGFGVQLATSPWQLEGNDSQLVAELIQGIGRAVQSRPQIKREDITDWLAFRLAHVTTGSCRVGHTDLLAVRE